MPERHDQLLFGIFALQFNFISREDLIAVTSEWTRNQDADFAQLLSDRGVLTDERRTLLQQLISEHNRCEPDASLASVVSESSLGPVEDALRSLNNDAVNRMFDSITAAASLREDQTETHTPHASDAKGRFRVLRPHAKGGLGHVSVALDRELHREVALKEIDPRHADNVESRARFVQEAEITGSLEHPGIVPVYGLGVQTNGRPFYVMRFIRGDSLKEAITKFHEGPVKEDHSLQLRQLLFRRERDR